MDPKTQLWKEIGTPTIDPQMYCSMVGSLIYLTNTRSNICYAVSCVSKYMNKPEQVHFITTERILSYLARTSDYGLFLLAKKDQELVTYADAG
jgi:hypothetical protein